MADGDYGSGVYGDGLYGFGLASQGYGAGAYGAGPYGGTTTGYGGGSHAVPVLTYVRTPDKPVEDDETLAVVLALL